MKLSAKEKKKLGELFGKTLELSLEVVESKQKFVSGMVEYIKKDRKYISDFEMKCYRKSLNFDFDYLFIKDMAKGKDKLLKKLRLKSNYYMLLAIISNYLPLYMFAFSGYYVIKFININYTIYAFVWQMLLFIAFFVQVFWSFKKKRESALDELNALAKKPVGRWGQ